MSCLICCVRLQSACEPNGKTTIIHTSTQSSSSNLTQNRIALLVAMDMCKRQADAGEQKRRKCRFDVSKACPPAKKIAIKVSNIVEGPTWCSPPPAVIAKLGNGGDWLFGVDIETHDWEATRGIRGKFGKFGHWNLCAERDVEARIVQLGWCFGPPGFKCTMKERLVRPVGFEISEKAAKYHGITQETAARDGMHLADVLSALCADLLQAVKEHNARLVCHHLEFDSGILGAQ